MKSSITLFLAFLISMADISAEKHALIIAIGDYPQESYWPDISSNNDVHHIQSALLKLGWSNENIINIHDAQATYEGIIKQFKQLQGKVKKGDVVFIHYSGHGQQVADDNQDELDNLDEAIVPYDSPMIFEKGKYEGERLIRDDLLGSTTKAIRKILGTEGQLILILDSCHSGTGTRGMGKVRGTDRIMAADDFVANLQSGEKSIGLSDADDSNLAPMASFYGASPRELNYETIDDQSKPVGSLSYAMASVLAKMEKIYSFEELYERVKLKMKVLAPRQNPQWEGPGDVLLLGGKLPPQAEYYSVIDIVSPTMIKANVGTISDVFAGTTVEIHSKDKGEVISRGTVTEALLTQSSITLDTPISTNEDELIIVMIKDKAYAGLKASVSTTLSADSKWNAIANHISSIPIVESTKENADLYLSECGDDNAIQVATRDGSVLYTHAYKASLEPRVKADLVNIIRAHIQGNFLKSYENPVSNHEFDLAIVIVDCNTSKKLKSISNQDGDLPIGSCVQFKVTNTGIQGAYFSLIDIQPDNMINLIAPAVDQGYTADEYYLKPGASYITSYNSEIAQPAGQETIKLISSKSPLDLSGIISSRGQSTRGIATKNPFEQMFAETYNVTTRGVKIKRKGEEVGTKTLYFNIVEK